MGAQADQMIAAVIDTALVHPWVVVVVEVTHPRPMTTITSAVALLVATAHAATTTAADPLPGTSMTGVTEVTDDPHLVVAWEDRMSMVHHAPATLTILTMLGPDHHLVATTIPTSTVTAALTRLEGVHRPHAALVPAAREAVHHTMPQPNTHLAGTRVLDRY